MALLELYKKIYPMGNKVAYYRPGLDVRDLGIIVGYETSEGCFEKDSNVYIRVQNAEFPEYMTLVSPREDRLKVYYTKEAEVKDQKNRYFF